MQPLSCHTASSHFLLTFFFLLTLQRPRDCSGRRKKQNTKKEGKKKRPKSFFLPFADIGSSASPSGTRARGGSSSQQNKLAPSSSAASDRTCLPSRNFIHYSQDGFLTENGSLAFPINIEETMAVLTRCSFDESHRQPISLLGGIPALAELIQVRYIKKEVYTTQGITVFL